MLTPLTFAAVLTLAQLPTADIEQWAPSPLARSLRWVGTGGTAEALEFRVSASTAYLVAPFRSASGAALLFERYAVTLTGALGITDWLELGVVVPVYPSQGGSPALPVASAGLGNPWVHATVAILGETRPLTAALSVGLGVPAGTAAALGNGQRLDVHPKVVMGRRFSALTLGVELGALIRRGVDFSSLTGNLGDWVGSQAVLAVSAAPVVTGRLTPEVAVRGFVPLTPASAGLELQVGARYALGDVDVFFSAGPGLGGQPATPGFRALLGVALRAPAKAR